MTPVFRLVARSTRLPQCISLALEYAAAERDEAEPSGPAALEFGDGQVLDLGVLYPPTLTTWRDQRTLPLADHTYVGTGPFTSRLLVGATVVDTVVDPASAAEVGPQSHVKPDLTEQPVPVLSIEGREGRALEWVVKVAGAPVPEQCKLRLDGGAGQVHLLSDQATAGEGSERRLAYAKSGTYTVALDLLDQNGFWLATLAEQPLEITALPDEALRSQAGRASVPPARFVPTSDRPVPDEPTPWLPFQYARPSWSWLRTHSHPGSTTLVRVLGAGTYLSIHAEMEVGDALWYQTAAQDWVLASAVDPLHPSDLRGATFRGESSSAPGALAVQPGVVTAALLNVRAQPGIRADNPPLRQLGAGAEIHIYEVARHGGSTWYRIGPADWVHTSGVRLAPLESQRASEPAAQIANLPAGWVVAPALNVRPRPGISAANTPIGRLTHYQALPVLETYTLGGVPWYRAGVEGWVEGTWVAVAELTPRPAQVGGTDRWLAVSVSNQTLVAYEGDCPVYASLVATGHATTPTPTGLFNVYRQRDAGRVSGGNPTLGSYHDLEDVPWLSYFYSGYALLGAYWHDSFGRPRSHGCVNLSPYDAWWLYRWSVGKRLSICIY